MKKAFKIILCTVLSLLLLLLVSENYLYYQGYKITSVYSAERKIAPEFKDLFYTCGWAPIEHKDISYEDSSVKENTWPDGQRVNKKDRNKQAPYKVLFLGCSYTYGMGVNDQDTYVWHLNEKFPNIVFDNYGVPAYSTYQCLMLMDNLLKRKKYNMVVYAFMGDHLVRNTFFEVLPKDCGPVRSLRPYVELLPQGLQYFPTNNSYWPGEEYLVTVNFYKRVWRSAMLEERRSKSSSPFGATHDEQLQIFQSLVERMQNDAQKYGSKFVVLNLDPQGKKVLDELSPLSFPTVDVSFPEIDTPLYRINKDMTMHPNSKVHKIWADKIAQWFQNQGF